MLAHLSLGQAAACTALSTVAASSLRPLLSRLPGSGVATDALLAAVFLGVLSMLSRTASPSAPERLLPPDDTPELVFARLSRQLRRELADAIERVLPAALARRANLFAPVQPPVLPPVLPPAGYGIRSRDRTSAATDPLAEELPPRPPHRVVARAAAAPPVAAHTASTQLPATRLEALEPLTQEDSDETEERAPLAEEDLRTGLSTDQIKLWFQPIFLPDGTMQAADTLLRWQHPVHGLVLPGQFLPAAARAGILAALSSYTVRIAMQAWRSMEARAPGLDLILRADLAAPIDEERLKLLSILMTMAGCAPNRLIWDVSSSQALASRREFANWRRACHEHGNLVSLSNWTAGDSLLPAAELGADEVKIDCRAERVERLYRADVRPAQEHGLRVVAAGLDFEDGVRRSLAAGVDRLQGFVLGKPLSLPSLLDSLAPVPAPRHGDPRAAAADHR